METPADSSRAYTPEFVQPSNPEPDPNAAFANGGGGGFVGGDPGPFTGGDFGGFPGNPPAGGAWPPAGGGWPPMDPMTEIIRRLDAIEHTLGRLRADIRAVEGMVRPRDRPRDRVMVRRR